MPLNDPIVLNGWTIVKMADEAPPSQPKYWDYYVYQEALLYQDVTTEKTRAHIKTTLDSFAAHEFTHGNRIKQMLNSNLCTIRVTLADRIGFSYIGRVAILHGFIPAHQLDKYRSLFVNNNITRYQSLCQHELQTFFTDLNNPSQTREDKVNLPQFEEECVNYDQYIVFSNDQSQITRHKRWPIITGGPPGTGKSVVLAKRLEQEVSQADPNIPLNILCITYTRSLTKELEKMVYQDPSSNHRIQIIAYEDWILPFAQNRQLIDDKYLEAWYHDYIDKRSTQSKAKLNTSRLFKESDKLSKDAVDTEAIKHMFKYYAGRNPATTSKRDFLFSIELRDEVIQLYRAWLQHLEDCHLLHPAFFAIPKECIPQLLFDFSFIDETQIFTKIQVDNVVVCTKFVEWMKRGVYLNYDSGQALMCHASHREELISKLIPNPAEIASHYQNLEIVYRSVASIVEFVNVFLEKVKYFLLPEPTDKYESTKLVPLDDDDLSPSVSLRSSSMSDQTDHELSTIYHFIKRITWVKDISQIPKSYDFKSGHWGVITHEAHLETAIQHFGNAMTPLNTIGLKYRYLALFNFFDHELFTLISKLLQQKKNPSIKVKFNRNIKLLVTILNAFSTAALRAEEYLLIIQPERPQLKTLIELLQLHEFNESLDNIDNKQIDIKVLEKRLITLIVNKQLDTAKREFTNLNAENRLGMSYETFESIHATQAQLPILFNNKSNVKPIKQARTKNQSDSEHMLPMSHEQSEKELPIKEMRSSHIPTPVISASLTAESRHLSPKSEADMTDYLKNLYESLDEQTLNCFFALGFAPQYCRYQVLNVNHSKRDLIYSLFFDENKSNIFIAYLKKHRDHLTELYLNYEDAKENKIEFVAIMHHRHSFIALLKNAKLNLHERYNRYGETPLYFAFTRADHITVGLYEDPFQQPLLQTTKYLSDDVIAIDYSDKSVQLSYKKFAANPSEVWRPLSHLAGYNDFFEAVYLNDIITLCKLVKNNPKLVHTTLGSKRIAGVHIAAQFGYTDVYKLLVDTGAPPNLTTAHGWTALMIAARFGDTTMIKTILKTAEIDFETNNITALRIAMAYDKLDSIILLLHCSAHINMNMMNQNTVPSQCLSLIRQELKERNQFADFIENDLFSWAEFLTFYQADPTLQFLSRLIIISKTPFEKIPLIVYLFWRGKRTEHICDYLESQITSGRTDLIEQISNLTHGLDNMSTLHVAAKCGNNRLLKILFGFTKYPRNALDGAENTPLANAMLENHTDTVELLLSSENGEHAYVEVMVIDIFIAISNNLTGIIDKLLTLATPAVLNDQTHYFQHLSPMTPLMYCVTKEYPISAAKLIRQQGVDHNLALIEDGKTALYLAAELNRLNILMLLLAQPGIQIDPRCKNTQYSPLIVAIIKQFTPIACALITAGADVNILSDDGLSPINYVCKTKNAKCLKLMINRGASINLRVGQKVAPLESAIRYKFFEGVEMLLNADADLDIPEQLSTSNEQLSDGTGSLSPAENSHRYKTAESIAELIPDNEKIIQRIQDERIKRSKRQISTDTGRLFSPSPPLAVEESADNRKNLEIII